METATRPTNKEGIVFEGNPTFKKRFSEASHSNWWQSLPGQAIALKSLRSAGNS